MKHLWNIETANTLFREGRYEQALEHYLALADQPEWAGLLRANIEICYMRLNPGALVSAMAPASAQLPDPMPAITVTLTTIRARLHHLQRVIDSLLAQSLPPTAIEINVSREPYLLDEGIEENNPVLARLMALPRVRVNWVPNTGPYRKLWYFLERHFAQPPRQHRLFVTVDDDTLYPEGFLAHLYQHYLEHDCIIAFRGRGIQLDGSRIAPYDIWSSGKVQPSLGNLPTGKDGILYSTRFFTRDFLQLEPALKMAPTADDLWIKWHCALNGVGAIILNPQASTSDYKSFPVVSYEDEYRGNSLYARHNASHAQGRNDASVQALEDHYRRTWGYNLAWLMRTGQGERL